MKEHNSIEKHLLSRFPEEDLWEFRSLCDIEDELEQDIYLYGDMDSNKFLRIINGYFPGELLIEKTIRDLMLLRYEKKEVIRMAITNSMSMSITRKEEILDELDKNSIINYGYVYAIEDESGRVKIGRTKELTRRTRRYITENADKMKLLDCAFVEDMIYTEKELHEYFKKYNIHGEWHDIDKMGLEFLSLKFTEYRNILIQPEVEVSPGMEVNENIIKEITNQFND